MHALDRREIGDLGDDDHPPVGRGEKRERLLGFLRWLVGNRDLAHRHLIGVVVVVLLHVVGQLVIGLLSGDNLDGHGLGVHIVGLEHEAEEETTGRHLEPVVRRIAEDAAGLGIDV